MISLTDYILNNNNIINNTDTMYLDDLLESVSNLINENLLEFDYITEAGEAWSIKDGYYVKQNGDVLLFPDKTLYDKQININKSSSFGALKHKHLYNYMLWAGNHAMERHNERKVSIKEITDCVKDAYPTICDLYKQGKLKSHDASKTVVIVKYMGENEPPISIVLFVEKASRYNKETNKYEEWPTLYKRTPDLKIKTVAKYYNFSSIFRPDGKNKNNKTGVVSEEYHIYLDENGKIDNYQKAKLNAEYMKKNNMFIKDKSGNYVFKNNKD